MTNKEVQDPKIDQKISKPSITKELDDKFWSFCPVCGTSIPKLQKLKFCIKCGTDLNYLKKYKQLNPNEKINHYVQPNIFPQYQRPSVSYESSKIDEDEITNTKKYELWGTMPSIGIPLGAFLLMDFLTAGILAILIFFSLNLEALLDAIANPYFIIFSSFFELIFIIVPVLYVGKYLKKPSLKNRLGLLGFTSKRFDTIGIIKEILIGLGFAVVGVLLVYLVSFLTEIFLEFFFGIEIIRDVSIATSDTDIIPLEGDILGLILLSLVMILIIGTSEEILFRGFMQKGLSRSLGHVGGIMITAFIFAMIHVLGIVLLFLNAPILILVSFLLSFTPYFMMSLLFGLIYYWRNENLIAVIITHGVYNTLTIIIAYIFTYTF
ncbi:MAG: CPBP family intramembrane glutamic endopeptidase [Promethearchaeota archaeon]